jgi:hypothetical protein
MLLKKNIKYKFFILIMIWECVSINRLNAQTSIGVKGGYTNNCLNTSIMGRSYTHQVNLGGYSFGVFCERSVSRIFAVRADIELIQKNYSFQRTEKYKGIYEDYYNTYCQLPVILQVDVFKRKKFNIALNTGVFGAYWIYAKVNGVTPNVFDTTNQLDEDGKGTQNFNLTNYSEKYQFNKQKDNRFEFGLLTGINIQYDANEKNGFFIECLYYQSLTDIQKKYMENQVSNINQTLQVSVGFLLKLNSHKKTVLFYE